jgi:hypothetical protein
VTVARGDTVRHAIRMVGVQQAAAPPRTTPAAPATPPAGSGQCTDPGQQLTYNANGVCFDRGPRLTGAPSMNVASIGGELPPWIMMYVQVAADGRVLRVQHGIPRDQMNEFQALGQVIGPATTFLRQNSFQPALKAEQPVQAWGQVQLRLTR